MSVLIRQKLQRRSASGEPGFRLDVDLTLPASGITVLFGRSGCGKSTLLRCVAGLEKESIGRITAGEAVWQDSASGLRLPTERRGVGYVFQGAVLFPHLSVRGNLEYALRRTPVGRRHLECDEAIAMFDIAPLLDRSTGELSGGERQRVALARTLLSGPELLLLDEPLASLDRTSRQEILPHLEDLARRFPRPILYVTHYLNEAARLGDHLVLMRDGGVAAQGPLTEMLTGFDSPLAHGADAGAVFDAEVLDCDREYHLARLGFAGGVLLSTDPQLKPGRRVRVRIQARDVSLALERPTDTSILNVLPVRVESLTTGTPGRVLVRLELEAGEILLAVVTEKSAAALDLDPYRRLFAQIKSVALL